MWSHVLTLPSSLTVTHILLVAGAKRQRGKTNATSIADPSTYSTPFTGNGASFCFFDLPCPLPLCVTQDLRVSGKSCCQDNHSPTDTFGKLISSAGRMACVCIFFFFFNERKYFRLFSKVFFSPDFKMINVLNVLWG